MDELTLKARKFLRCPQIFHGFGWIFSRKKSSTDIVSESPQTYFKLLKLNIGFECYIDFV